MIAYDMGDISQEEKDYINKKSSSTPTTSSETSPTTSSETSPTTGERPVGQHNQNIMTSTLVQGQSELTMSNILISQLQSPENQDFIFGIIKDKFSNIEDILKKNGLSKTDLIDAFVKIKEKNNPISTETPNARDIVKNDNQSYRDFMQLITIFSIQNIQNNIQNLNNFSTQVGEKNFFTFLIKKISQDSSAFAYTDSNGNPMLKSNVTYDTFWKAEILASSDIQDKNEEKNKALELNTQLLKIIIQKNTFLTSILKTQFGDNNFDQKFVDSIKTDSIQNKTMVNLLNVIDENIWQNNSPNSKFIIPQKYITFFTVMDLDKNIKNELISKVLEGKFGYKSNFLQLKASSPTSQELDIFDDLKASDFLFGAEKYIQENKANFEQKKFLEFLNNNLTLNGTNLSSDLLKGENGVISMLQKTLETNGIKIDKNLLEKIGENKISQNNEKILSLSKVLNYLNSNLDKPEDDDIKKGIDQISKDFDIPESQRKELKTFLSQLSVDAFDSPEEFIANLMSLKQTHNDIANIILKPFKDNLGNITVTKLGNEKFNGLLQTILTIKIKTIDYNFDSNILEQKILDLIKEGKIPVGADLEKIRFAIKYGIEKKLDPNNLQNIFSDKNFQQELKLNYESQRLAAYQNEFKNNTDILGEYSKDPKIIQGINELFNKTIQNPSKENLKQMADLIISNEKKHVNKNKFLQKIVDEINNITSENSNLDPNLVLGLNIFKNENFSVTATQVDQQKRTFVQQQNQLITLAKEGKIDWTQIIYDQTPKNEIQPGSALDKYAQSHVTATEASQADASLPQKLFNADHGISETQPLNYNLNFSPNQATLVVDGKQVVIPRNGESSEQFKTKLNLVMPKLAGMPDFMLDGTTDELAKIFSITKFELNNDDLKQTADKFGVLMFNMIDEKINFLTQNNGDLSQIDKLKEIRNEFFAHGSLEGMRKFFNDMKSNGQSIRLQDFFADSESFKQVFSLKDSNLHLDASKMANYLDSKGLYSSMRVEKYYISQHLKNQNQ